MIQYLTSIKDAAVKLVFRNMIAQGSHCTRSLSMYLIVYIYDVENILFLFQYYLHVRFTIISDYSYYCIYIYIYLINLI